MEEKGLNPILQRRLELHEKFISILGTAGEKESRVYFQPPNSVAMKYPAIRYEKDGASAVHADNGAYLRTQRYRVTVIDPDPDSVIAAEILSCFPLCMPDRSYRADNLNHDTLILYY